MKLKVVILEPQKGYLVSWSILTKMDGHTMSTLNVHSDVNDFLKNLYHAAALCKGKIKSKVKHYDFSDKLYNTYTTEVELYPYVMPNYNGYTMGISMDKEDELNSEMSLAEYYKWNAANVAKSCSQLHKYYWFTVPKDMPADEVLKKMRKENPILVVEVSRELCSKLRDAKIKLHKDNSNSYTSDTWKLTNGKEIKIVITRYNNAYLHYDGKKHQIKREYCITEFIEKHLKN